MTRTTRAPAIAALLGLTMLGGCAEMNTVHRAKPVSSTTPTVITIDAKQRHLLMVPEMVPATTRTITADGRMWEERITTQSAGGMRVCAEAAPDVFSAMAASGTLDLSAGAKSKSGGADIGIGYAISETAAAIRRTQTVNLARESFYRTCERYMSGAISKTAFGVQAARDFRQAIAMLAIEQLTGVVEGPTTIISGGSTGAEQTSPAEYYSQLQSSSEMVKQANQRLADAESAAKDDKAPCKVEDDEETEAKAAREKLCETKKKAAEEAKRDLESLEKQREKLLDMSKDGPPQGGLIAKTGAGTNSAGDGKLLAPANIQQVALSVKEIALAAMRTDETLMFCLQALSGVDPTLTSNAEIEVQGATKDQKTSIKSSCLRYMTSSLTAKADENFLLAEKNFVDLQYKRNLLASAIEATSGKNNQYTELLKKIRKDNDSTFCKQKGGTDMGRDECANSVREGNQFMLNKEGLEKAANNLSK
jgi:hypothetical protein